MTADARAGRWRQREPQPRAHYPVGVMGLGVLGQRVLHGLRAFDFPLRGWSRTPRRIDGVQTFAGPEQWHEFLAGSRVLVNLLPLTPETENILNHGSLSRLLPGAYLINVARGRHLVDEALLALLDNGHLTGALLDVFRQEPLPKDDPFWSTENILVLPHIGGLHPARDSMVAALLVENLRRFLDGAPLKEVVDRKAGY